MLLILKLIKFLHMELRICNVVDNTQNVNLRQLFKPDKTLGCIQCAAHLNSLILIIWYLQLHTCHISVSFDIQSAAEHSPCIEWQLQSSRTVSQMIIGRHAEIFRFLPYHRRCSIRAPDVHYVYAFWFLRLWKFISCAYVCNRLRTLFWWLVINLFFIHFWPLTACWRNGSNFQIYKLQ